MKLIKNWNGELRFLPNFKLRRISKKQLDVEKNKSTKESTTNVLNSELVNVTTDKEEKMYIT